MDFLHIGTHVVLPCLKGIEAAIDFLHFGAHIVLPSLKGIEAVMDFLYIGAHVLLACFEAIQTLVDGCDLTVHGFDFAKDCLEHFILVHAYHLPMISIAARHLLVKAPQHQNRQADRQCCRNTHAGLSPPPQYTIAGGLPVSAYER